MNFFEVGFEGIVCEHILICLNAECIHRVEYVIICLSSATGLEKSGVLEAVSEVETLPAYAYVHIVALLVKALDEQDHVLPFVSLSDGFKDGGAVAIVAFGFVHGEVEEERHAAAHYHIREADELPIIGKLQKLRLASGRG